MNKKGHSPYTISTVQRKIASTNCCMHFRCSSIQRREERSYRQKCVSCPTIWGKRREIGRWAVCQHRLLNGTENIAKPPLATSLLVLGAGGMLENAVEPTGKCGQIVVVSGAGLERRRRLWSFLLFCGDRDLGRAFLLLD